VKAVRRLPDGTGPKVARSADAVTANHALRARTGRLTWADEIHALAIRAMTETEPAEIRSRLLALRDALEEWITDLETRE
jgi:hypothetical protein